ncbi:MAG: hypothetical protein ACTHW7_04650 [Actinomycetaceae bacterium]
MLLAACGGVAGRHDSTAVGADDVLTELRQGRLQGEQLAEGATYVLGDQTVVMRDGELLEVSATFCEGAVVDDDGEAGLPPCWDPPYLVLSLEDGVTLDDLGIERRMDGWLDTGEITFRVTDAESEPPTAVLLEFESA